MAERKSGPVKPPVIDLTARPSTPDATKPDRPKATAQRSAPAADTVRPAASPPAASEPAPPLASKAAAPPATTDAVVAPSKPEVSKPEVKPEASRPEAPKPEAPRAEATPVEPRSEPVAPPKPTEAPPAAAVPPRPAAAANPPPPRPEPPRRPEPAPQRALPPPAPARRSSPLVPITAGLGGGIIGLGLAYALALGGLWPTGDVPPPQADPRIADLEVEVEGLHARLQALPDISGGLEAAQSAAQTAVRGLADRLSAAESAAAADRAEITRLAQVAADTRPFDATGLAAQIAALGQRIDAVAAGASSDDAAAMAGQLSALQGELTGLSDRLGGLGDRLGGVETAATESGARLDGLTGQLDAVAATQQQLTADRQAAEEEQSAARLPASAAALGEAIGAGRPFATELAALIAVQPDLSVPAEVGLAAEAGLAPAETLLTRYQAALPAMLAARNAGAPQDWQTAALDGLAALLVLRPAEEMAGDSPEALLSRLEPAIARADFTTAAELFAALPEPMRAAAGDLPAEIASRAAVERFLLTVNPGTPS